jgi:DNA repair exonuclease SbcCD ATPase subunit
MGMGGWSASSWRWYTYLPSGDMTAAGNITAYSDPRLKEEIVTVSNALEKIKQLNGVKFKWIESSIIGHPGEYDYGILSTDVEKIAPELVIDSMFEAPEGDRYKTVAYDKLVAFLIEAIKEQQTQIEQQQTQIEELRELING